MSAEGDKKGSGSGKDEIPSEFCFAPGDHPGMVLTSLILDGDNYLAWSRAIRNALRAKKKLGFLDGNVKKPDEAEACFKDWEAANSMLIAWLSNTMDKEIQATVNCEEDVKALWDDLREKYAQGNLAQIYEARSRIWNLRQEGCSVREYYGKLKKEWRELDQYVEKPNCSCGANCSCVAQKIAE